MTKKITPSLSSNHSGPTGKNFKTRFFVWILLVCAVTAVAFSIGQSRKNRTPIPNHASVQTAKQDMCITHLTQCQQEKMQLALKIQETENARTQSQTFDLSMRLAAQLMKNKPFAETLAKLQADIPAQAELRLIADKLADYADQGVPTIPQLQQRMDQFVQTQTRWHYKGEKPTWYEPILQYITTMIRVRPVKFENCKTDVCKIYKAQHALHVGRLNESIKTLEQVRQPPKQLIDDMRARAFVDSYLAEFIQ